MKFFKNLQINSLVTSIIYIALGLIFILLPEMVTRMLSVIVGIVLAITGVAYIISYFRHWDIEYKSNGLAIGLLFIFGALFLVFQNNVIAAIVPMLLGFAVVVSGAIKLQNAIVLNKAKEKLWIPVLVLAGITLALGVIIMINPFAVTRTLIIFIGASLFVSGVTDLVIIFLMSRRSEELQRAGRPGLDKEVMNTDHVQSPRDAVQEAVSNIKQEIIQSDSNAAETVKHLGDELHKQTEAIKNQVQDAVKDEDQ